MSSELGGVVRTILAALFGWLAGKGYFDAETGTALAGAFGTILVAGWSIWQKMRQKTEVKAALAATPPAQ